MSTSNYIEYRIETIGPFGASAGIEKSIHSICQEFA